MAKSKIDELNILKDDSEAFDYQDFIDHYYDPMQISERQKKKRKDAAEDIFDAILFFLIWCENAPDRVEEESTLRSFENLYKEVIFQHGEPDEYFDTYVSLFIPMLIKTTLAHIKDAYYTSVERAALVAANESNSVVNHTELQEAIEEGYTQKKWLTELDEKVRFTHQEMEGVTIPINEPFHVGQYLMMQPHDISMGAGAEEIVNCRCSLSYLNLHESGGLSGAYNDKNDPLYEKRDQKGRDLYSEIKNRKKQYEIEAVARNSGYSLEEIDKVYKHVFLREHLFEDGSVRQFDPDYYMANSWLRIRNNDNIQEHDLMMIKHELEEEKIMGESLDIPYEMAHNEVEMMGYSYQKLLDKYLETHDV